MTSATSDSSAEVRTTIPSEVNVYDELQWMMERAHDCFKLGHANMLKHLENPPMDDLPNFLGYCNSWASSILMHHDTEEAQLFPFLSKYINLGKEIEQQKSMHDQLDSFLAYMKDPNTLQSFSAEVLRMKLEALRDPLFNHLDTELIDIDASRLRPHFTQEELESFLVTLEKDAQGHPDLFTELPFFISHIAPPYRGNFPEMPWFARNVVVPVVAWRFAGKWKYSPYSAFSVA